ncbi:unnamed protein product, partial [Brachionus calyciflorus]
MIEILTGEMIDIELGVFSRALNDCFKIPFITSTTYLHFATKRVSLPPLQ